MSPFPPCGTRRTAVKGQQELELRTLSAWEAVEAGREAETLEQTDRETALCVNACILARALERRGKPLFPDGEAVLRALSVAQIAGLARPSSGRRWTYSKSRMTGDKMIAKRKERPLDSKLESNGLFFYGCSQRNR